MNWWPTLLGSSQRLPLKVVSSNLYCFKTLILTVNRITKACTAEHLVIRRRRCGLYDPNAAIGVPD